MKKCDRRTTTTTSSEGEGVWICGGESGAISADSEGVHRDAGQFWCLGGQGCWL